MLIGVSASARSARIIGKVIRVFSRAGIGRDKVEIVSPIRAKIRLTGFGSKLELQVINPVKY